MPSEPEPIADQLARALAQTGVSVRELARRLSRADGTQPETKRRWLNKILAGDGEYPEPESLRAIETALELTPETLTAPRRGEGQIQTTHSRLLELEARLDAVEALQADVRTLQRIGPNLLEEIRTEVSVAVLQVEELNVLVTKLLTRVETLERQSGVVRRLDANSQ